MKNSIFYYLLVLLIVASCKEQPKESIVEKNKADIVSNDESIDYSDCYHSREIPKDAAAIWINSWKFSAFNTIGIEFNTPVPEHLFSKNNIKEMMPDETENKGALIYYILKDRVIDATPAEGKIPSLAMIATNQCKSSYVEEGKSSALISWHGEEQVIMTKSRINDSLLVQYRKNWTDFLDKTTEAHIEVEGYFYSWSDIADLLEGDMNQICIRYGVRTLGPEEIYQFEPKGEIDDPSHEVGIPVLCNIIFGLDKNKQTTDQAFATTTDHDFARPCPAYCAQ